VAAREYQNARAESLDLRNRGSGAKKRDHDLLITHVLRSQAQEQRNGLDE
jgi:hypothetical protein